MCMYIVCVFSEVIGAATPQPFPNAAVGTETVCRMVRRKNRKGIVVSLGFILGEIDPLASQALAGLLLSFERVLQLGRASKFFLAVADDSLAGFRILGMPFGAPAVDRLGF